MIPFLDDGLVYIDTPILIYSVEKHPRYVSHLSQFWKSVEARIITVLSSELTLLECLILPFRKHDKALIHDYQCFFDRGIITLLPISREILHEAALLRGGIQTLKTPDAIHADTALSAGCKTLFTNDNGFSRVSDWRLSFLKVWSE